MNNTLSIAAIREEKLQVLLKGLDRRLILYLADDLDDCNEQYPVFIYEDADYPRPCYTLAKTESEGCKMNVYFADGMSLCAVTFHFDNLTEYRAAVIAWGFFVGCPGGITLVEAWNNESKWSLHMTMPSLLSH